MTKKLILYSKNGCHLCEGLEVKLLQITELNFDLEIRDIMTNENWFEKYQYEIPVLALENGQGEDIIPRPSPRISVAKLQQHLQKYF